MSSLRRALALALVTAGLAACSLDPSYLSLRLEAPSLPAVKTNDYREIAVTDFFLPDPVSDINLSQEVAEYFRTEVSFRFTGPVSRRSLALDKEEKLKDEAFWKEAASGAPGVLFLTGKARLEQELRKALMDRDSRASEEPFAQEKTWNERKSFTLQITLLLIDGGTGRPIFEKEYKETANYANTKQPVSFALFDMLVQLKLKFFRTVFGSDRLQDRYLIFR
jgi:hypothetical protein